MRIGKLYIESNRIPPYWGRWRTKTLWGTEWGVTLGPIYIEWS